MIFAINEGLKDLQNYLREEQKASGEEEKDPNLSLATKDLSPSEVSQVIQSFSSLYKSTCQDFNQKPKDSIVNSLDLIITDNLDPHVLDLCGNPVSFSAPNIPRITDEQVFPLFEVLGHLMPNSPFSSINLSFNHIRNHGANALAVFLTHSQTLTGLNLRGNDIGEAGCIKMAENLSTQMTLKSLDLNTNPIGDTGMSKLADSLVANTTLTDLDIGNTELSTLTLVKMAVALTTNKTLTKLNIDKCLVGSIQEETTIHIAKALAKNATLTDLSMANHRIRDHGANWLAEYLGKNKTLQRLNLSCNYIGTDGVCALAAGISNRPVGCEILLDNNMNLKGAPTVDIEETIDESLTIDGQITVEYHTKGNNHSLVASMYNY